MFYNIYFTKCLSIRQTCACRCVSVSFVEISLCIIVDVLRVSNLNTQKNNTVLISFRSANHIWFNILFHLSAY